MGDYEESPTGNWNLSSPYVEDISRILREANMYKEIAKFGFTDILMDLSTKEIEKTTLRKRAVEKYIYKLKDVILYSKLAMKTNDLKKKFQEYYDDLQYLEDNSVKEIITTQSQGMKNKEIINEDMFKLVFRKVEKMDMDMREPMNQADLIFMHKESFDPHKFKEEVALRFKEGM